MPLNDNEMRAKLDYRAHTMNPDRFIKKGINIQKWLKKSAPNVGGWLDVGNVNAFIGGSTGIKATCQGFADMDVVGKIWTTYYVTFRNPII